MRYCSKLFFYFLATSLLCLFSGCETVDTSGPYGRIETPITTEEKIWLNQFFTDILLDESAVYTLFGSKPMTSIILNHTPDEELEAAFAKFSEEEKKAYYFKEKDYNLIDLWNRWEEIQSRFPSSNYLFFKKPRKDDPVIKDIYFINIRQTAFVIEDNYELFKQCLGYDFDPLDAIFEIGDDNSLFWQKASNSSTLLGVLFGFGKKNAQCFDWKYWRSPEENSSLETFLNGLHSIVHKMPEFLYPTPKNFDLPSFASFSPEGEDEVVEKYKIEREKIKKIYSNKDFVDLTLQKLTSR